MTASRIATTSPLKTPTAVPVSKALLVCGILAAVLYVAMMQLIRYDGYSWISQVPSELTAIGTPTRTLWAWLGWVYTALMIAFGWGVWKSAGTNRPLRRVGALILTSCLLAFAWPFASMHQRAVLAAGGGTLSDTLHKVLGVVTALLFMLIVGFGAAAFGRRFRLYSIATIVIALVFGALLATEVPALSTNQPTPWIGLWERINIAVNMLWIVVLATTLLRAKGTATSGGAQ